MTKHRRRVKHETTLKDRLVSFAMDARDAASQLPAGVERDDLIKCARRAETAAHLDEWINSSGLQPPI
jgi:hypothetical protein